MPISYKQLVRYLFPASEDERCLEAASQILFTQARPTRHPTGITLLPYRHPAVRAAIHLAKFHHHPLALKYLGSTLAMYTKTHKNMVFIPIPLSPKRYRERGYNQVVEIIKASQKNDRTITFDGSILYRSHHTKAQSSLGRAARSKNMVGAFAVHKYRVPQNFSETHVVILDDVMTTGATLEAARAALAPLKPKSITCVALAH